MQGITDNISFKALFVGNKIRVYYYPVKTMPRRGTSSFVFRQKLVYTEYV